MIGALGDFVTMEQFARKLKKHPRTLYRWSMLPGGFPTAKIGKTRFVHLPSAEQWFLSRVQSRNPDRRPRRSGKR
jgi:hypothetical protein